MNIFASLLQELTAGKKAALVTAIDKNSAGGVLPEKHLFAGEDLTPAVGAPATDEVLAAQLQKALNSARVRFFQDTAGVTRIIEPFFPEPRLIILGGGHIAVPLAEFGAKVGFKITVVDDRLSFANERRFPWADQVLCTSFQDCFRQIELNQGSYLVIVTRGHRHDQSSLRQALQYDPAYIGMIGSRRRVHIVKSELLKEGVSQEKLDTVQAPIGLPIGAVTPEEIAVSIIAQVIACRRKANWPDPERDILEQLSREQEAVAIVTVIGSQGSVPREAGAKMIVWPDGQTIGSIGGGCAESDITLIGRDVIRNKKSQFKEIDLTGSAAEEEGMVCGGTMQVLIEYYEGK
ncbi:MAG: XdhC family protein [Clostridia bacterium]|jgi:xanthine dehydrogenase accessory factor|nr:XdhC family protein [Clostridia bacterium]